MAVPNEHVSRTWWDIACVYEGEPKWAIAFGETAAEAETNFKNSLLVPELVVVVAVKPVPECTGIEAMSACSS
jgi:hypothetical protein